MQISVIVYNDVGQGEGWRVSWNAFGYCCSVSHLCERDFAAIRSDSGAHSHYPEHVDEQAMFPTVEEAYAFFHSGTEQWRRTAAEQLFSRIDAVKFPVLRETSSVSPPAVSPPGPSQRMEH